MAIVVGHNPSAAAIGYIAYKSGANSKAERLQKQADENRLKRASLNLESKRVAVQHLAAMAQSRREDERLQLQKKAIKDAESDAFFNKGIGNQSQISKPVDKAGVDLQKRMIAKMQTANRVEYKYSPQQKKELQLIETAISDINKKVATGAERPEVGEELIKQLIQRRDSTLPEQTVREPTMQEMFETSVIKNENGVSIGYMTQEGKLMPMPKDPIGERNSKENIAKLEVIAKERTEKLKYKLNLRKLVNPDGQPLYNDEQIAAMVAADFGEEQQKKPVVPELYDKNTRELVSGVRGQTKLPAPEITAEDAQAIQKNKGVKTQSEQPVKQKNITATPTLDEIEAELRRRGVKL